jgi:hypothetical protein
MVVVVAKRGVKRSSKQRAMVSPEVRRAYTGSAFKASPDRLRERSQTYSDGTSGRQGYNRMTYGQVDVSDLGNARDDMNPYSRGGWGHGDPSQRHNVPRRQAFRTSTKSGKGTRVGSTNKALQSADVSMMQGYENRRTTKNIQAYKGMR